MVALSGNSPLPYKVRRQQRRSRRSSSSGGNSSTAGARDVVATRTAFASAPSSYSSDHHAVSAPSTANIDAGDSGYLSGIPYSSSSSFQNTSPFAAATNTRYPSDQLDHQKIFADKRGRLLALIEAARNLVTQVREANTGDFAVKHPPPPRSNSYTAGKLVKRRSVCVVGNGAETSVSGVGEAAPSCPNVPVTGRRAMSQQGLSQRPSNPSSSWGSSSESAAAPSQGSLQVLNLDLKIGNTQLHSALIAPESVPSIFDQRFAGALAHLDALTQRVADSSSKILVTGDLNAGKSTFVNALLRREILPVDQQPCTTHFCEVLDATQGNDGVEEVHAVPVGSHVKYDRTDPRTYVKVDLRHLEKVIDNDHGNYSQLKIYCGDRRSASESLLHNGIIDIALVDSPGLNRDSLKTTALFARQQEIDVIVFVVSAENHFTLSGKEFLWNAGNEKAHIFIVVNRFDLIRKKDKCRSEILNQIRQLSPHTYEDAEDLVHFVSAGEVLQHHPQAENSVAPEFARLEHSLRNFVLDKRARSKLLPAKRYLSHLLGDLSAMATWNREARAAELDAVTTELERDSGIVNDLKNAKKSALEKTERIIEETSAELALVVRARLVKAADTLEVAGAGAEWTGVVSAWTYALDVRDRLVEHVMSELRAAEAYAHDGTMAAVHALRGLGAKILPASADAASCETQNAVVPSTSTSMLESQSDGVDSGDGDRFREKPLTLRVELTDFLVDPRDHFGVFNVAFGAAAVVGTKLLGFQNILGVACNVVGAIGLPRVRNSRMTWSLFGISGICALAYLFSDVQRTVERRLTSKLRRQLAETGYADTQAARTARRSRRQLRLAGWDLQNRFQVALLREERKRSDLLARGDAARAAEEWFASIGGSARRISRRVAEIEVDG